MWFNLPVCEFRMTYHSSNKMIFLCLILTVPLASSDQIVTTNSGPVRGVSLDDGDVEAFLGIPYAEPPVGELRFAKPVPKSSWKETYDANKLPPSCIQAKVGQLYFPMTEKEMSEDCLFLNLWVPQGGSDQKPIMLFIHGGAFMIGSSNWEVYDGAELSERGDVIVATINYRVGTLGFFSGFIDEAAGNSGLYDQVMAIQWIKDNAKHFRGDPDNIVLFGESAGSFSVSLHMISPLSKNLFRRAILQSGSVYHPFYSDDNSAAFAGSTAVATMSGCASGDKSLKQNPEEVVDCMKRLPAETISEIDLQFFNSFGLLFPRVGDDFLPEAPTDLYRKGEFKDGEVLFGLNRDEGPVLLSILKKDIFGIFGEKVDENSFNETAAKQLFLETTRVSEGSGIFQSYLDRVKGSSRYTYLSALGEAFGDFFITCSVVYQADYQSMKNIPVYFYLFDYRPPSSTLADWIGVAHFDEVQYVFGNPMYAAEFTEYEEEFSKDIMDMWIAFAKTGNPNIPGGLEWPSYTFKDPKYYRISQKDGVGVRPDNYRCEKWRKMFRSEIE